MSKVFLFRIPLKASQAFCLIRKYFQYFFIPKVSKGHADYPHYFISKRRKKIIKNQILSIFFPSPKINLTKSIDFFS